MNRKVQLQLLVNPIVLVIGAAVIIAYLIGHNVGYKKGFLEANSTLMKEIKAQRQQLDLRERQLARWESQLRETEENLNQTLDQLNNCTIDLNNKKQELDKCKNSGGVFPLFWTFNIYLTKMWIFIINIVITIALLKITIDVVFQKRRRK